MLVRTAVSAFEATAAVKSKTASSSPTFGRVTVVTLVFSLIVNASLFPLTFSAVHFISTAVVL